MDWSVFERECRTSTNQLKLDSITLDNTYNLFISHIHNALLTAGAKKHDHTKNIRKPPTAWWDEECYELIKNKSTLFKNFKANPSINNYDKYIAASKAVSKNFLNKKRDQFRKFCSALSPSTPINKIWQTMRSFYNPFKTARGESSNNHISLDHFVRSQAFDSIAPPNLISNSNQNHPRYPSFPK